MRTKTLTTEAQRSHREPQRGSANAPRFIFQQPARAIGKFKVRESRTGCAALPGNISAHARMAARSGGKLLYEALATEKNRGKLPGPEASDSFRSDPPGRRGRFPGLDL